MLPEPKSPYAITKLDGEYYCRMFAREGRLPTAKSETGQTTLASRFTNLSKKNQLHGIDKEHQIWQKIPVTMVARIHLKHLKLTPGKGLS